MKVKKKNILVVEDTSSIREELSDILRMEGYNVFEAADGKSGLEIAKNEIPNLIISDILMPELDGFELIEELAKNENTKNIPFIFLSAKANKEAVIKGKEMGAEEYLIKPITPDHLLTAVNKKLK